MTIRSLCSQGFFGDEEVRLHFYGEDAGGSAPLFVILHGVHGSMSPVDENKYGFIAKTLAGEGYVACLAESSRLRRDKESFGMDRVSWAMSAFRGKTFAMEVCDAFSALDRASAEHPGRPVVLWGFSLGGLIAVILAGKETGSFSRQLGVALAAPTDVSALVISGSGDRIRTEASTDLTLPVLDTMGSSEIVHNAASKVSLLFALLFYGGRDETFDEESSRRIFRSLRLEDGKKEFHILPGVDHSFRTVNGVPSTEPLEGMISLTRATLERFQITGAGGDRQEG